MKRLKRQKDFKAKQKEQNQRGDPLLRGPRVTRVSEAEVPEAQLRKIPVRHVQPKTQAQDRLLRAAEAFALVVASGSAGTGKTYCAVQAAVNCWARGEVERLVLTRANIPTGKSLGFFPGSVTEKLEPWLSPMISVLKERLGLGAYGYHVRKGNIVLQPLETIRGSSFDNTILLVDEAQNLSLSELKALTTRIGESSKIYLMGDSAQSDLNSSDLLKFIKILQKYDLPVGIVNFTSDDIVRSDLVGQLVRVFEKEGL